MTVSALTELRLRCLDGRTGEVVPILVTNLTSQETVYTPVNSSAMVAVVGMSHCETSAHNVTVAFGSTTHNIYEFAGNSGFDRPLQGNTIYEIGAPGEALKLTSSSALSNMKLYVCEVVYADLINKGGRVGGR